MATFEQLVEKMREQAPLAGISDQKQGKIVEVIAELEKQQSILPLVESIVR